MDQTAIAASASSEEYHNINGAKDDPVHQQQRSVCITSALWAKWALLVFLFSLTNACKNRLLQRAP